MYISEPKTLDDKGRCCGRKPAAFKRPAHLYCGRCNRSYSIDENSQIPNWAWKPLPNGYWECQTIRITEGVY